MAFKITDNIGFGFYQDDVYARVYDVRFSAEHMCWAIDMWYYLCEESRAAEKEHERALEICNDIERFSKLSKEDQESYTFFKTLFVNIPKKETVATENFSLVATTITTKDELKAAAYKYLNEYHPSFLKAVKC